ncbi:hypothetical protein DPMN_181834 [Dreissena polymorpha]|uniref:Uncharacterized protein n=1 Tax=Dreissena polymorpha TaxID=45954 RepID=A0A9D4DEA5_DREPO|nr:hypothetical protein DPMN_181834 [Dreissena polymorpha]
MLSQIPILPEFIPHLQWWLDEETLLAPSSCATIFVSYDGREQGRVGCSSGTTLSDSFRVVVSS